MTITEAARLVSLLAEDPTSQVHAALAGWGYPVSREAMAVADLFDAFARANYKKFEPYPRPWETKPKGRTVGKGTALTPAEFHAQWSAKVRELSVGPSDGLVGAGGHDEGDDPPDDGPAEQQVDPEDRA